MRLRDRRSRHHEPPWNSRFIQSSALVYRGILCIYPVNLRHNFGEEMAGVFTDDLEDALIDAHRTRRLAPVACASGGMRCPKSSRSPSPGASRTKPSSHRPFRLHCISR